MHILRPKKANVNLGLFYVSNNKQTTICQATADVLYEIFIHNKIHLQYSKCVHCFKVIYSYKNYRKVETRTCLKLTFKLFVINFL